MPTIPPDVSIYVTDAARSRQVGLSSVQGSESHFWAHQAPSELLEPLRKRAREAYMELQDLLEYRRMNYDGFRKILKKHDKVTQSPLTHECMPEVDSALPADQEALIQNVCRCLSLKHHS